MKILIPFVLFLVIFLVGCNISEVPRYDTYSCNSDADCKVVGNLCKFFGVNKKAEYKDYKENIPYPPNCKNTPYQSLSEWVAYCESGSCKIKFDCSDCEYVLSKYNKYNCANPGMFVTSYCSALEKCNC